MGTNHFNAKKRKFTFLRGLFLAWVFEFLRNRERFLYFRKEYFINFTRDRKTINDLELEVNFELVPTIFHF